MLPHHYRWLHLLIASCVFYMFFIPVYILILFFTIIIDYYAGILIEGTLEKARKKRWLVMSLIANIGVLCVFKYCNFFIENVNTLFGYDVAAGQGIPYLSIILPIGLSFHTFQAMSYTIEVYRGNQKAERHLGIYALYVMFYPQLVAGPIERPQNILHQFYEKHEFEYTRVVSGLRLMLWGMFKKVVVADRLSIFVDAVYSTPGNYEGMPLIWASVFFSFQIYCDFSGYSDIALGSARVMGFDLMRNFNVPYTSTSIKEFWSRWHISLSSWFRDYLYIPLGGNRVNKLKRNVNLFIVFLLSGFWHGANWTFIIWGTFHGLMIIIENTISRFKLMKGKLFRALFKFSGWIYTLFVVNVLWVFFRAKDMHEATVIIRNALKVKFNVLFGVPLFTTSFYIICTLGILTVFVAEYLYAGTYKKRIVKLFQQPAFSYVYFFLFILFIYTFGVFEKQNFIYFQF